MFERGVWVNPPGGGKVILVSDVNVGRDWCLDGKMCVVFGYLINSLTRHRVVCGVPSLDGRSLLNITCFKEETWEYSGYVFDGVSDTDFGILISVFGIPVLASLYWYLVSYLRKVCTSDLSLLALLATNHKLWW